MDCFTIPYNQYSEADRHLIALKIKSSSLKQETQEHDAPFEIIRELENLKQLNIHLEDSNNTLLAENEALNTLVSQLKQQSGQSLTDKKQTESIIKESELVSQLQAEKKLLAKRVEELTITNKGLQNSLKRISSDSNLKEMKQKSQSLKQENRELSLKLKDLESKRAVYWFIAGALVFITGMISGRIFSKKTRKFAF